MRQMMGFFQVSEHRQDREIPWSQSQIADYGEWWCSDLQDLAAKPTLWWSILCFVRARKHSWCTTHVRWPKRCGEEKQQGLNGSLCQGIIDVQNMKLCYVRFGKVQLWLVVGILQINYRSGCYHVTIGIPPGGFSCSKEEELARLQYRLGMAYFFPFFQPENAKFQLVAGWKCSWNILKCSGRW
jgi:hypothetical protein